MNVAFPGPASAMLTLQVPADGEGVARVLVAERIVQEGLPGLRATIPAFNRLLVEGDPSQWDPDLVQDRLEAAARAALTANLPPSLGNCTELPACYDPEIAPDLSEVARLAELPQEEVVRRHHQPLYTVLATGFAPGFAYMGDVDDAIATPRRSSPRGRVPKGAVGIADRRTGVYPTEGPGGWQLIARVPPTLFQSAEIRIGRFATGSLVRFRPITRREYEAECG